MNPYDFVRINPNGPGVRRAAQPLDRFGGINGRLEGTITTLTPLFIPDTRSTTSPKEFLRNGKRDAIIPGSSLKGLFRSLVETLSGGAWWLSKNTPQGFAPPASLRDLDAACRMFGFMGRGSGAGLLLGRVGFEDAVCKDAKVDEAIYTCILSSPKPRHTAWYEDDSGQPVGRKFYYHSQQLQTTTGWLPRGAEAGRRQNAYIKPVKVGSTFTFSAHFSNLDPDDFALLLYCIVLEPNMRHKIGYAKPAGLGSVEVTLRCIEIVDYVARYRRGQSPISYVTQGEGQPLEPFIEERIRPYVFDRDSVTLQDLRRIWHWPPEHVIRYPSRTWFDDNSQTPIDQTP